MCCPFVALHRFLLTAYPIIHLVVVRLQYNYEKATKLTIPAVRIATSLILKKEHGMNETEIAKRLGITQAAVNKQLNGNYTPAIKKIVDFIMSNGLENEVVDAIVGGQGDDKVMEAIDKAATDRRLLKTALQQ